MCAIKYLRDNVGVQNHQKIHKIRTVFLNMILNEKICVDNASFAWMKKKRYFVIITSQYT